MRLAIGAGNMRAENVGVAVSVRETCLKFVVNVQHFLQLLFLCNTYLTLESANCGEPS